MNSINLVALPKKFSFMRWRLFGAFCQNTYIYIYTYFMCIFTVEDVLKIRQCHDMGLKLKYMISMIIAAIPKNVFFYEVEPFVSILSKYIRTLIQSVFHVVGMLYSIIDVYDLNQSIFWDTLYGKNSL